MQSFAFPKYPIESCKILFLAIESLLCLYKCHLSEIHPSLAYSVQNSNVISGVTEWDSNKISESQIYLAKSSSLVIFGQILPQLVNIKLAT
jgi:hypothetical protein